MFLTLTFTMHVQYAGTQLARQCQNLGAPSFGEGTRPSLAHLWLRAWKGRREKMGGMRKGVEKERRVGH